MAMQSGKGAASGSGPDPALSDEQAEQFAASFHPAWDAGEDEDAGADDPHAALDATLDGASPTLVDAVPVSVIAAAAAVAAAAPPPAPPTVPVVGAVAVPAGGFNPKSTLIGTAPQANVPAGAAARPPAPAPAAGAPPAAPPAPPGTSGPGSQTSRAVTTLGMPAAPHAAPANGDGRWQEQAPSRPPSPQASPAIARPPARPKAPAAAVTADPFRAAPARAASRSVSATDEHDVVPKKSSKTMIFVIAGLAVVGGLGLFLKFALSEDPPARAPESMQPVGPAATTADIPPPPPKLETAPTATMTAAATTTAAPAKTDTAAAPPTPLALPPQRSTPVVTAPPPDPPRAPITQAPPRQPTHNNPPPAAVAPAAAPPKTPPKSPNGGIVRDNPF